MSAIDLATTYLGLRLGGPFIAGASPIADHLDTARRLEDGGASALVMHSLFEEQITMKETGRIHHMDPLDHRFAAVVSYFPEPAQFALGVDEYLEHLRRLKAALAIPVIGSLNGTTPETWLKFATLIQQAGADALELNVYAVVSDPDESGAAVEQNIRRIVGDLKRVLTIAVAVKLSPFFSAFGNVARQIDRAGADGLVLFNRFLQPDIDIQRLAVWPHLQLSTSEELLLRLRWLALLHRQVRCSLAATGGVATPTDGIKALLAGADVVQLVSAILRHGPAYFAVMRDELRRWMESMGFRTLDDVRGRLSHARTQSPSAFERAQYLRTISAWSSWLGLQAALESHPGDEPERPN